MLDTVHDNFRRRLADNDLPPVAGDISLRQAGLSPRQLKDIFHAQVLSRRLDLLALQLKARGECFYTIGSSGHEGSAAVAAAFRPTDIAFLHYREAAFVLARARQVGVKTAARDMLLSFTAAAADPVSGGRHKVLGGKALNIPPQTSTIASHLPKAVGTAYAIGLAKKLARPGLLPPDAVALCSFGDASLNHSTAQGAFNAAEWAAHHHAPLPLVFICADNGVGISTKTPPDWIEATMSRRFHLRYLRCAGWDAVETFAAAADAADWARRRQPVFLHVVCVRLGGHAGDDEETVYLSADDIAAAQAKDPLLFSARRLTDEKILTAAECGKLYADVGDELAALAEEVITRPKLKNATEVAASIVPPLPSTPPRRRRKVTTAAERDKIFGDNDLRALAKPQPPAKLLNFALTDIMLANDETVMLGEDIGKKGGVYGVTRRLQQRFGAARVIDSLLDEQSILGTAIGLTHNGFLPLPEIQFLAYLHNAEDQLRGEAATLPFFSAGQYANPMVVRIAGLAYQRGFGGHFHNDNSLAVLRDIPGLIIACPSDGADGVRLLRECVRLARQERRLVVFIEPIALYHTRDLHQPGDGLWLRRYPPPDEERSVVFGEVGGDDGDGDSGGADLAIVTYGNGYYLSRQAEKILSERHGIRARVIDIRWLSPLPAESLLQRIDGCRRVLIVDECRRSGSPSEALLVLLGENTALPVARVTATDSFIATGPAFAATLPSCADIVAAATVLQQ